MLLRIVLSIVFIPQLMLSQHTISGVFSPASQYKVVLLYKVTPTISEYITSSEIQKDGSFKFHLDGQASSGMYRIVYAVPQEDYNFDVIYNALEDVSLSFNSETGVVFNASKENMLLANYTKSMSDVSYSISNYYRENKKDSVALRAILKKQKEVQIKFEKLADKTIALNFIKANKPYVPDHYENAHTYLKNLKLHYFDNIDFGNQILQSSSFLEERMNNYVFGMIGNSNDEVSSYKNNIDVFYNAMKELPIKVKRILLVSLWQQMADMEYEKVANYISQKYLMEIAKFLNDSELVAALSQFKKIALGSKAPNFPIKIEKNNKVYQSKLSELEGFERYIIVFWSTTCSHCTDELPQLQKFIKSIKQHKIKVIAIALEDDAKDWKDKIKIYPEFYHVVGLGKWDNEIGNNYNVTETPTYFILDKNKYIINKPADLFNLKAFF